MNQRLLGIVIGLVILVSGCATGPSPGGAGEVTGPLRTIEFYMKIPQKGEWYSTAARERLFASDKELYVISVWDLPGSGEYVTKAVFRMPTGAVHGEHEFRFRAEASTWLTGHRMELPQGEAAQALDGRWEVEISFGGTPVGRRGFTFDPGSICLRTEARILIQEGKQDFESATGDYIWLQRYAAMESAKAAHSLLRTALRDELARRFPRVESLGPERVEVERVVVLTPSLLLSPNPSMDSRLDLEVAHLPTKAVRKFQWRTAAGLEQWGTSSGVDFGLAAVDLAMKAASSREVLEFLIEITQAVAE